METLLPYLAFSMGFMSSFHCLGMCGPIALAIPVKASSAYSRIFLYLLYNIGRAVTYMLLGLIVGSIASTVSMAGYFSYFSIAIGVLLVLYAVGPSSLNKYYQMPRFWQFIVSNVKKNMAAVIRSSHPLSKVFLGMLNGLLPCGMVTMALAGSMATGTAVSGGIFMFLFGIGTFPAMLGIGLFKEKISPKFRSAIYRLSPVFVFLIGIWLIIRGLLFDFGSVTDTIPVCTGI